MTANIAALGGTNWKGRLRNSGIGPMQADLEFTDHRIFTKEFYLSSAQILALFATPITILSAPGAGYAIIFRGAIVYKPAGTAYAGIAATEDIVFRYTDASGAIMGGVEATGFLDQTTVQVRYAYPQAQAAAPISSVVPVANAVLKVHMAVGEITTGTSPLLIRLQYSIIPTDLSYITSSFTST